MDLFTADPHFNHKNIIEYCNRPFKTVEEMNETLITNWNSVVRGNMDTIYIVGDFGFGDCRSILKRLNGRKVLILGSHDKSAVLCKDMFDRVVSMYNYREGVYDITLCHYAMRVWPRSHYNSWHLFGHSHNRLGAWGKSFDVGVDGNNFMPWTFDQIKAKMETLDDNFNLIGGSR